MAVDFTVVVAVGQSHIETIRTVIERDTNVSAVRACSPGALDAAKVADADCLVLDRVEVDLPERTPPVILVDTGANLDLVDEVPDDMAARLTGYVPFSQSDPTPLRDQIGVLVARRRAAGPSSSAVSADGTVGEGDVPPVAGTSFPGGDPSAVQEVGSERLFEALVELSSDILMILDAEGTVLYISPSVERVLGWSRSELVGEDIFEYIHPDDREEVHEPAEVEDPGVDSWIRFHILAADGDWRVVEAQGSDPIEVPGAEGYIVNLRDVTEQAARRTELERQNERLDQFASIVSHDLRNPLNVAVGNLKLTRETGDSRHLEQVEASLRRMERLIDDLLRLARQGEMVTEFEPVDLGEVAVDAWDGVDTADATLTVDASETVTADSERLRELLGNLFRNALEHGGEAVSVTVGPTSGGFFVADDGPGIDEADRSAVFDRGYTTAEDGTGFGLAIVEEIATAHGWSVRATESVDGGARFEIST